jgi:hypothetical protein
MLHSTSAAPDFDPRLVYTSGRIAQGEFMGVRMSKPVTIA